MNACAAGKDGGRVIRAARAAGPKLCEVDRVILVGARALNGVRATRRIGARPKILKARAENEHFETYRQGAAQIFCEGSSWEGRRYTLRAQIWAPPVCRPRLQATVGRA